MPDEKAKSSNVPKQKSSRQTHINDLLITTAYRQQIRNEFLENVRKDISNMCEIANVAESERNKRIEQLNDETRALIECANEYMAKANEQLASLARTDPSTNTNVNIEELIESTKEEFRQMFEMYMKEFRFDKIYVDDLIEGAVNEFALTEPTFRSHDNTIEMELMRKIAEKEKQIENEEIQHRARMLMMEREKEKLQMEIKMLEDEAEQKRKHALNDEDTEKRWLQKEIESLEEGLKRINTQIETLRRS